MEPGSQGAPVNAVQISRSRPRSDVSVVIRLVLCRFAAGAFCVQRKVHVFSSWGFASHIGYEGDDMRSGDRAAGQRSSRPAKLLCSHVCILQRDQRFRRSGCADEFDLDAVGFVNLDDCPQISLFQSVIGNVAFEYDRFQ